MKTSSDHGVSRPDRGGPRPDRGVLHADRGGPRPNRGVSLADRGVLLAYSRALPRGPRVRLRLVRPRDRTAIRDLFERISLEVDELELARLTNFDPRTALVVCATTLIDRTETMVGVGSIKLDADASHGSSSSSRSLRMKSEPELLVVDEQLCEGLTELLHRALVERAAATGRAGSAQSTASAQSAA